MAVTARYVWLFLCLVITLPGQFLIMLATFGKIHEWYPKVFTLLFSESSSYYYVDFRPLTKVVAGSFSLTLIYEDLALLYLLKHEKEFKVFSSANYITLVAMSIVAYVWCFAFCTEKMVISELILVIIYISSVAVLIKALQRRVAMETENVTASAKFWFDRLVLDAIGSWFVWYAHSTAYFGAIPVLYEDGPHHEDNFRGWLSVEDGGTLCLSMFFIPSVLAWIVADLFLFHHYTKHVKIIHPMLITTALGVLATNVSEGRDLNRNVTIYVAMGILTFIAWMKRGPSSQAKEVDAVKME